MASRQAPGKTWRPEIIIALIGFLGVTTAAVINKWDVLFPSRERRLENRGPQPSPAPMTPVQPGPEPPRPQPAAAPPEIVRFTASQTTVRQGQRITLSWVVRGAHLLRLSPGEQTVSGPSGSFDVTPDSDITYVLTATGGNGRTTAERVGVRVVGPPLDPSRRNAEVVKLAIEATRALLTHDVDKLVTLVHEPFSIGGREMSGEPLRRELQALFDRAQAQIAAQRYELIATDVLTVPEYRIQLARNPKISVPKLDARLAALNLTSEDFVVMIGARVPDGAPTDSTPTFVGYRGGRCKLLALE